MSRSGWERFLNHGCSINTEIQNNATGLTVVLSFLALSQSAYALGFFALFFRRTSPERCRSPPLISIFAY